jgi:predicted peptidase
LGQSWSNEPLMILLDEICKRYRVDEKRIYITGISMGGFGTWNLGTTYPERFAAIVPICGGGQVIDIVLAARGFEQKKLDSLRALPIWAFHGAKDTVVPISESEHMLAALKEAKIPNVKFTVYPEAEHDAWTETYNNPKLYEWFLQKKKE